MSSGVETIRHMIEMGVDVLRINTSHGTPQTWDEMVASTLKAEGDLDVRVGLAADLEGPRVRTANREPVTVEKGSQVVLGFREGDIPVEVREFFEALEEGDLILIDDGNIILQTESVEGLRAKARVMEGGVIGPRKGVVIKRKEIPSPNVTLKDRSTLAFVSERPFSHVYVSYARDGEHVETVKSILRRHGRRDIRVYAKIESPRGVENVREIVEASDGVIVARGDLGMHYNLEELPVIQERIVAEARRRNKPVILATEFLSSMLERPHPTRSEITDIYQAVNLQVDALMLTSETAIGKYPLKSVMWMNRAIARAVEALRQSGVVRPQPRSSLYKLALGLVELSESLGATLVVYSMTGRLAERVASFRPLKPFYVGVPSESVERVVRGLWGAEPVRVPAQTYEEGLRRTVEKLEREGVVGSGDLIVEAAWSREQGVYIIRVKNISE
jgi:pyruvate kinase